MKKQTKVKQTKAKRGRPTKYREGFCDYLIGWMTQGKSVVHFCGEVDISVETFYQWVKSREDFAEAYKKARAKCQIWWLDIGQANLISTKDHSLNSAVWYMNMKNRFGWNDKKNTYDVSEIEGYEGTLAQKVKALSTARKNGKMPTDQFNMEMSTLAMEAKIYEVSELDERVTKLEGKGK